MSRTAALVAGAPPRRPAPADAGDLAAEDRHHRSGDGQGHRHADHRAEGRQQRAGTPTPGSHRPPPFRHLRRRRGGEGASAESDRGSAAGFLGALGARSRSARSSELGSLSAPLAGSRRTVSECDGEGRAWRGWARSASRLALAGVAPGLVGGRLERRRRPALRAFGRNLPGVGAGASFALRPRGGGCRASAAPLAGLGRRRLPAASAQLGRPVRGVAFRPPPLTP